MRVPRIPGCHRPRHGAAAVELALIWPPLLMILVGAADFAQIFGYSVVLTNCARNGAIYGSKSPTASTDTAGIQAAALEDADTLSPTVTSSVGSDANGNYVIVTVTYNATLYCSYLGIADTFVMTRTARMRVLPAS